jgi:3-hydroxyisobutyrate dehydrogenase-like beta-hydroxyacid dehydrogenase
MTDITVVGLGAMGTAIAKTELQAGYKVTVWNRSTEKAKPLIDLGAAHANNFGEAIQESRTIIICIDNYDITHSLLGKDNVIPYLNGKIIVQVSNGTPSEARKAESWLAKHNAAYIDGSIMCFPSKLGDTESSILVSGNESAFNSSKIFLEPLGGDLRYLGENPGAATAVALAVLSVSAAAYMGVAHGAHICRSEDVEVAHLASVLYHGDKCREMAEIIHESAYELSCLYDGASMDVYAEIAKSMMTHANETGTNAELPKFLSEIYDRGVEEGYGDEDRAALVKVL